MIVDPFPFKAFETVVRCSFDSHDPKEYRFVHYDGQRGLLAFFDLGYTGAVLRKMFVITSLSEVAALADDAVEFVEDSYIGPRMKSDQPRMSRQVKRWWVVRWQKIRALVSVKHTDEELLEGHKLTDLYVDPNWRDRVISKQALRLGFPRYRIVRELATFVRYGGTSRALMPQTDRCGAPGQPKCLLPRAKKSGRPSAKQRRLALKSQPRNRFNPFWDARMREAIDALIARDAEHAAFTIMNDKEFLGYFFSSHCWVAEGVGDRVRRPIDPRRIPTERSLLHHRNRLVRAIPELAGMAKACAHVHGGDARDLTFGVLDIVDVDGAKFPEVCLVVADDESVGVSRKNCVYIGPPTVILGICRKSSAYAGWYVTAGPETGQVYRHCFYNILMDKDRRLRELDMNPADYPGIATGAFDQIVVDRGPGASKPVVEWTTEGLKLDVRLTRAGVPQDKGTVEGGISRVKEYLRRNRIIKELLHRETLRRLSALPRGVVTLQRLRESCKQRRERRRPTRFVVTSRAFEKIVVEALNAINLERKSDPRCLAEEMVFAGVEPTSAAIFRYFQSLRRGNAAYPRRDHDLREALLEKRIRTVSGGKIQIGHLRYGSPSSVPEGDEGAQALLSYVEGMAGNKPVTITVVPEPYGNYVWWLRGVGDWVLLAPDKASAARCPIHRDWIEIQAFQDDWNMRKTNAREKRVLKHMAGSYREAKAEQVRIHQAQAASGESWAGPVQVDRAARRRVLAAEQLARYNDCAGAAGLPKATPWSADRSAMPHETGSLPSPWESSSSLAGMLAEDEAQTAETESVMESGMRERLKRSLTPRR